MRRLDRLLGRLSARLPDRFRVFAARYTGAHRKFVARSDNWDLSAASQFGLLALLGLRAEHSLLEVGCGSLRVGRLLIVYLEPGCYFAIEPERWLVEAAIEHELGRDLVRLKRPTFDAGRDFRLTVFGRRFDFVLAGSVLAHAAPSQIRACLAEARGALAAEGLFVASFLEAETDHAGESWVYPGRAGYRFETLRAMAAEAGLDCERLGWLHDFGAGNQTWVAFAAAERDG